MFSPIDTAAASSWVVFLMGVETLYPAHGCIYAKNICTIYMIQISTKQYVVICVVLFHVIKIIRRRVQCKALPPYMFYLNIKYR